MATKSITDLRDFARFTFKNMQEVIRLAIVKNDIGTVEVVAKELEKALQEEFRADVMVEARLQGYRLQIENLQPEDDKDEIEKLVLRLSERVAVTKNLEMAKQQIYFGLAGYAVEQYIATQDAHKRQAASLLIARLPNDLGKLVTLYESVADDRASDVWGWGWWDVQADGEAHFVDTFTRPNRLFIIRALQTLAMRAAPAVVPAIDDDMIFAFESNNAQGVFATLDQVVEDWQRYDGILGGAEQNQIDALRALFRQIKRAGEDGRELKLRTAPLVREKIEKFKEVVAQSFEKGSRLRKIFERYSKVVDRSAATPPEGLRAWGYNQLDDKGAFIADWHVTYPSWGEAYGKGLAQAETDRAFGEMAAHAQNRQAAPEAEIMGAILVQMEQRNNWRNPIILETLINSFAYTQIRESDHFEPRFSREVSTMAEARLEGFRGIIKAGAINVPVFAIHVRNADNANKVLICELDQFAEWDRYWPTDQGDQLSDVHKNLLIKVFDLNAEDDRRLKIIEENPPWLAERGDEPVQREQYLRTKVVVNVYDKYRLRFLDNSAAVCIAVINNREQ